MDGEKVNPSTSDLAQQVAALQATLADLMATMVSVMSDARVAQAMGSTERDRVVCLLGKAMGSLSESISDGPLHWNHPFVQELLFGMALCRLACKNAFEGNCRLMPGHEIADFLQDHCFGWPRRLYAHETTH
ncbi:hypothetical protein [Variovorax sp. DXTD-1]|uniref:hypothetical protein n=1 Tax=Variovorax sp. DXTD-1 TaxID=2495592 RepID=UPI000FB2134C|nr:hypothetical protein [Variovorax sp. DXTD-1]RST47674.1 hypothetical protein EJI00_18460 [Variovorax sp. DXTD-1]